MANGNGPVPLEALPPWKLEDAKARLSELIRRAREDGPQRVTVYGRDAVVVMAADDYAGVTRSEPAGSLHELLASSPLARLEIEPAAERSPVREVEF